MVCWGEKKVRTAHHVFFVGSQTLTLLIRALISGEGSNSNDSDSGSSSSNNSNSQPTPKLNGDHIVSGSALLDVRHGYDVRSKVDTRKEQRVLQGLRRREGSTC